MLCGGGCGGVWVMNGEWDVVHVVACKAGAADGFWDGGGSVNESGEVGFLLLLKRVLERLFRRRIWRRRHGNHRRCLLVLRICAIVNKTKCKLIIFSGCVFV